MRNTALDQQCSYWDFDGNVLATTDLQCITAMKLTPRDPRFLGDDALNTLSYQLQRVLQGLPDEYSISALSGFHRADREMVRAYARELNHSALHQRIAKERILGLGDCSAFFTREITAFICAPGYSITGTRRPWLPGSTRGLLRNWNEARGTTLTHVKRATASASSALKAARIENTVLSKQEFFDALWRLANPVRARREDPPKLRPEVSIRDQLFVGGTRFNFDSYQREGALNAIVSLNGAPENCMPDSSAHLTNLRIPHIISVHLEKMPQQQTRDWVTKSVRRSHQLVSLFSKGQSPEQFEAQHDEDNLARMREMKNFKKDLAKSETPIAARMSVWTCASNRQDLNARTDAILHAARQMGSSQFQTEESTPVDAFLHMLPGQTKHAEERAHMTTSSRATRYLPVFGEDQGSKTPYAVLKTRGGSLFGFDPGDKTVRNKNAVVIGPSGSGKSFFMRCAYMGWVSSGRRLCVLTHGEDYKQMALSLGGTHVKVVPGSPELALNFFATTDEWSDVGRRPDLAMAMVEAIAILITEEGVKWGRAAKACLNRTVNDYLNLEPADANLPEYLKYIQEQLRTDTTLEAIALVPQQLAYWTDGHYQDAFLRRPNLTTAPMIVWDTAKAGGPEEQAAIMALLTITIKSMVALGETQLIVDEAPAAMKSACGQAMIEQMCTQARKENMVIIIIAQSVRQFNALPEGTRGAILSNTERKFILPPGDDDVKEIKKTYELSERDVKVMKTLACEPFVSTEMLLVNGKKKQVVELTPNDMETWMATSHPPHLKQIRQAEKSHPHLGALGRIDLLLKEGTLR